jgi:hypothetical protein
MGWLWANQIRWREGGQGRSNQTELISFFGVRGVVFSFFRRICQEFVSMRAFPFDRLTVACHCLSHVCPGGMCISSVHPVDGFIINAGVFLSFRTILCCSCCVCVWLICVHD